MIAELQAAFTATKTALGMASAIQKLSTDTRINEAVIEIQRGILEAQGSVMEANDRIGELAAEKDKIQKELIEIQDWTVDAARYEMTEVVSGIIFYKLKAGQAGSEPSHYLCPNCFMNRKKSLLQRPTNTSLEYKCHPCGFTARTRSPQMPRGGVRVISGLSAENT